LACVAACISLTLFATTSQAQIDFSLNVFYTTPSNTASGGTWELVAKSGASTFGISAVDALLANINNDAVIEGPRGTVNGANTAGFQLLGNTFHPANPPSQPVGYRELIVGQLPLAPLPAGSEETYLYGVGTIPNGAPNYPGKPAGSNSIGPAFTSFASPQDIPWATGDAFGDVAWSTAARLLSGSFAAGVTPAFFTGSNGQVFTSVPATNTSLGNVALATAITTVVRTNAVTTSADYNHNGTVDAADYIVWRKTSGQAAVPPGSGADGNADGTVNQLDYELWRAHFGNPMGAGAGGNLSTTTVPEPAAALLVAIGALLAVPLRRRNTASS
jgi:hypothetical protein